MYEPALREALAQAFDGVISNSPGRDYWAAERALDVIENAGYVVVVRAEAERQRGALGRIGDDSGALRSAQTLRRIAREGLTNPADSERRED